MIIFETFRRSQLGSIYIGIYMLSVNLLTHVGNILR